MRKPSQQESVLFSQPRTHQNRSSSTALIRLGSCRLSLCNALTASLMNGESPPALFVYRSHRSSNGIIQERTADGLRDTEDPMMSLDILSPPLDAFTCRIATVFIFNGLGVMESIEDADPYNYLKERLCHLFPQRETRVEMEGIASNTELMLPDKELGLHPGDVDGERSGESSVEVPKDKSVDARSAAELMKSPESIQTEEMTHKKEIPINASLPSRERPEFPVRVLEDELAKSRSTAELMESPERIRTKKSIRNKRKKRRHCSIC